MNNFIQRILKLKYNVQMSWKMQFMKAGQKKYQWTCNYEKLNL